MRGYSGGADSDLPNRAHGQELFDIEHSEDGAKGSRDSLAVGVFVDDRVDEPQSGPTGFDDALTGDEDIAKPIRLSIHEGEQVAIVPAERIDRCAVRLSGLPAHVVDEGEAGSPACYETGNPIGDLLVETGQAIWEWHRSDATAAVPVLSWHNATAWR